MVVVADSFVVDHRAALDDVNVVVGVGGANAVDVVERMKKATMHDGTNVIGCSVRLSFSAPRATTRYIPRLSTARLKFERGVFFPPARLQFMLALSPPRIPTSPAVQELNYLPFKFINRVSYESIKFVLLPPLYFIPPPPLPLHLLYSWLIVVFCHCSMGQVSSMDVIRLVFDSAILL